MKGSVLDNLRKIINGTFLESTEEINLSVCANESLSGATTLFDILL